MSKVNVCQVCGHLEFEGAPEQCPVCMSPKEKYEEKNDVIHDAAFEGKEKHVPVLVTTETCGLIPDECKDVHIKVGSTPHPMQADHWIQWIDVYLNNKFVLRSMFAPDAVQAATAAHFKKDKQGTVTVVELCNKHGYWSAQTELK